MNLNFYKILYHPKIHQLPPGSMFFFIETRNDLEQIVRTRYLISLHNNVRKDDFLLKKY